MTAIAAYLRINIDGYLMHKLLPIILILVLGIGFFFSPLKTRTLYFLQNQVFQNKIKLTDDTSNSCVASEDLLSATGEFDSSANLAFFDGESVDYPKNSLLSLNDQSQDQNVLGTQTDGGRGKWIEVSLKEQKLRAWEGNQIVKEFPISSGLWYPTPPGDYTIYWKVRYIRMKGGSKELGTYYDLPNVPDTMFFYRGYALHGAYWHNNFGHPMSHGCVNEPLSEAHWLFGWAGPKINPEQNSVRATQDNPGTRVFIQ